MAYLQHAWIGIDLSDLKLKQQATKIMSLQDACGLLPVLSDLKKLFKVIKDFNDLKGFKDLPTYPIGLPVTPHTTPPPGLLCYTRGYEY